MDGVFEVFSNWWNLLLIPATSVVTWLFSRNKRKADDINYMNDALNKLQETCSKLVVENAELVQKVTELNRALAESNKEVQMLKSTIELMMKKGEKE